MKHVTSKNYFNTSNTTTKPLQRTVFDNLYNLIFLGTVFVADCVYLKTYSLENSLIFTIPAAGIFLPPFSKRKKKVSAVDGELSVAKKSNWHESLFNKSPSIMLIICPVRRTILDANIKACTYYGYSYDKLVSMKISDVNISSEQKIQNIIKKVAAQKVMHFNTIHKLANGEMRHVEVHCNPISLKGNIVLYAIIHDITERKKVEDKALYAATHDHLTKLPNRFLFMDRFSVALATAQRNNTILGILFFDLDGFKVVNDSYGHSVGDVLLQLVAKRLLYGVRKTDTVARFGGDEFAILLTSVKKKEDVELVAKKVLELMVRPFVIGKGEIKIGVSIGISLSSDKNNDADVLLKQADSAMYKVKKNGKNGYSFHSIDSL